MSVGEQFKVAKDFTSKNVQQAPLKLGGREEVREMERQKQTTGSMFPIRT